MEDNKPKITQEAFRDKALGCIIGAFIGDASGARLEFDRNITAEKIEKALKMMGGGPIRIGPGQITDDSELALCLYQGLIEGKGNLNPDLICKYYGKWLSSPPFSKKCIEKQKN